jgi:methionyl-tRNA synthetase
MARRYFSGRTPRERCTENVLIGRAGDVTLRHLQAMDACEFQRALEIAWELVAAVDGYVAEKAPWSIARQEGSDSPRLHRVLHNGLEALRTVAVMVSPVMPAVANRLLEQLGVPAGTVDEAALAWGGLPLDAPLGGEGVLFPRADVEAYFSEATMNDETRTTQKVTIPPVEAPAPEPAAPAPAQTAPLQGETELLSIDEFLRAKLVVGTVKHAERVPKSKKLVRLEVDLGEPQLRQVVAGIGSQYGPEELVNRQIVVVSNLKPATLMGVESRGMLLAASVDGAPFLLNVDREVPPGTGVK